MATYDQMSPAERRNLIRTLRNPPALQEDPQALPGGKHYEYDFRLKRTVEVSRSGERFLVVLVEGKLRRDHKNVVRR